MVKPMALVAVAAFVFLIGCSDSQDQPGELNSESSATSGQEGATSSSGSDSGTEQANTSNGKTSADSLVLRYKVGETYKYRVKQSSTSLQDTVAASTTSTHVYTKNVTAVQPGGTFEFDMSFSEIKMAVSMKNSKTGVVGMQTSFDSKKKSDLEDPMNGQFAYVIGAPVKVVVAKNTDLRDIRGVAAIADKIVKAVPDVNKATPQEVAQFKQQLEQQLTTTMFAALAVQEFVPYPDDLLLQGKTWTKSRESPLGAMFMLSSVTRYTITDVKVKDGKRLATVKAEMKGDITPHPQLASRGVTVTLKDKKMYGTSTAILNLDNGVTISKSNKINSSVTAEVTDTSTGQKQTVKQSQESHFEVTLLP